jgi:Mrp family chromosome partitioning ATPase
MQPELRRPPGTQSFKEPPNPASSVRRVVAVASGKGGVGKSSVTAMLAVLMQRRGYHAAVLDADLTGPSIPRMFGLKEKAAGNGELIFPARSKMGIDVMSVNLLLEDSEAPVVWRGPVIAGVVKQFWTDVLWNDVDILFIDLPPGTGDVPLTVFQTIVPDAVVMVATGQGLVGMIVSKALRMAQMMKVPVLGLVENMSFVRCPDCGKEIGIFSGDSVQKIADENGLPLLARIPVSPEIGKLCDNGMIELFEGNWLDSAADAVEALLKEEK